MNNLALISGIDIPIPEIQMSIHQPTIKEISFMGEDTYFGAIQTICFDKKLLVAQSDQGKSDLNALNNFQVFMTIINDQRVKGSEERKNNVLDVFGIFFPGFLAQLLPTGLYLNNAQLQKSLMINETNFDVIQETIKQISGVMNSSGGQNSNFNPKGKKAAEIAAKLMRGRQRVAQQGGKKSGVLGRYVSILTVALHSMSWADLLGLTVPQIFDLIERYGLYVNWDLDIRSRLAGGKPDGKPDDWMKDLY